MPRRSQRVAPWKTLRPFPEGRDAVAVLTAIPLQSYWAVPRFLGFSRQVQRHLDQTAGLIGYAVLARPWRRQFCVLSVWETDDAIERFVRSDLHRGVIRALQPDTGPIRIDRWTIHAGEYPPAWDAALARSTAGTTQHTEPEAHRSSA